MSLSLYLNLYINIAHWPILNKRYSLNKDGNEDG